MSKALIRNPVVPTAEVEKLVAQTTWFHRIEVVPGIISSGFIPAEGAYDATAYIDSLGITDVTNKRILEIGTWDGPLAFELKQRGADVVAADIQDPSRTGFGVLSQVSGLHIPYVRCSVYELDQHFAAEFDVVLFFGVFYHLKHPILAFEQIGKCLKPGGTLFCEGAGLGSYLEDLDGAQVAVSPEDRAVLERLDEAGVPLTLSYPGRFIEASNWILPNRSALRGWLLNAGLSTSHVWQSGEERVRVGTTAIRTMAAAAIEHPLTGEQGGYTAKVNF